MQTARSTARPWLGQVTHAAQLGAVARPLPVAYALAARPLAHHRSYATEPDSKKNAMQELQEKQMRLVDKMGRRKQTPTIVSILALSPLSTVQLTPLALDRALKYLYLVGLSSAAEYWDRKR